MSDKIDVESAEEEGQRLAGEAKLRVETSSPERLQEAIQNLAAELEKLRGELPEVYRDELIYEVMKADNGHPYIEVMFYTQNCYLSVVQIETGKLTPAYNIYGHFSPKGVISHTDRKWSPVAAISAVRRTIEDGIVKIAQKGGIDVVRAERAAQHKAEQERLACLREEADMYEKVRKLPLGLTIFIVIVLLVVVLMI